jgi:hypothetical protein
MAELRRIREEKMRTHRAAFAGRIVECITLHTPEPMRREGWFPALTENYLPVRIGGAFPANQIVRVRLTRLRADGELDGQRAAV